MRRLWAAPESVGARVHAWSPYAAALLVAVAVTLILQATASTTAVTTYDEVLLACIGALGLNLLMGTAGQLSIGSSAFLGVGAFTVAWASRAGIPLVPALVLALLFSGAVGAVVGLPGARLRGLEMALATVAAYFVVIYVLQEYETSAVGLNAGFTLPARFQSQGPLGGAEAWAWVLIGVVLATAAVTRVFMTGKVGRALRLIREHQAVAATQGIAVVRYKLIVFALSAALLGLEGALMAYFYGFVDSSTYTLDLAISYVAMVVIGGLDSIAGAVLGAAIVTALPTVLSSVLPKISSSSSLTLDAPEIAAMVYGVLFLVVLVKAPRGIVGLAGLARRSSRSRRDEPGPVTTRLEGSPVADTAARLAATPSERGAGVASAPPGGGQ